MKFVIEGLGLASGGGKTSTLRLLPSLGEWTAHEFVLLLPTHAPPGSAYKDNYAPRR